MDKTGFLKELEQHLAVLNESEQKDILDEYAQHIDMKMERGMSEAEAIGDFGDIEELAAEILEAYHVNPQYGTRNGAMNGAKKKLKMPRMEEIPVADIARTGQRFWNKASGALRRLCSKATSGLAALWKLICRPFGAVHDKWMRREWMDGKPGNVNGTECGAEGMKETEETAGAWTAHPVVTHPGHGHSLPGRFFGTMGSAVRWLVITAITFAIWCVRWAWNACMLFAAFLTGFGTLCCLFGFGVLMILLMQGYPLAGITIGCLGLVLCGGAVTVIAVCLVKWKGDGTCVR